MATVVVRIEHPVDSFDGWKRAFDSDPVGREGAGVRRYRILRPKDNPNYVMIDLEFDTLKQAESFGSAMQRLWRGPGARAVMRDPQLRTVEVVEAHEY